MNDEIDYLQMVFSDRQSETATDDLYYRCPLYWAAAFGQIQATELLRDNKHWINKRDKRGQTPLYVCVFGNTDNHVECARLLLEKEARTFFAQPDHYGKQPGEYADYPPMIEMLKEYVQITLCMDYSYPSVVIGTQDLESYGALSKVCAELSESQRDPKHMILQDPNPNPNPNLASNWEHMILQMDAEGDDEIDVDEVLCAYTPHIHAMLFVASTQPTWRRHSPDIRTPHPTPSPGTACRVP